MTRTIWQGRRRARQYPCGRERCRLVTDVSELEYRELLVPIVRDGSAVAPRESIQDARERCAWALDHLDAAFKRFLYPQTYVVGMEQGLAQVRDELVRKNMAAASAFPWAH